MQKPLLIFILFTLGYFLSYFYRSANAVIASDLATDLTLSAGQLGFVTSVFFLTFAAVQIPVGISLDRWGARWVTPGLLIVGGVGSLIFAVAQTVEVLTIGRGLIGVGMAGCLMGSLKMFSTWYPADRFATVSGLLVGIGSTGALFAATPMAWLNEQFGWRSVFTGMAFVTFVVAIVIMTFSRNTPPGVEWPEPERSRGGTMAVLRHGPFWRLALLSLLSIGTLQAFLGLWAGPYLFDLYNLSEIQSGNIILLIGIGSTLGYLSNGYLSDRFELTHIVLSGTLVFAITLVLLALRPSLFWVRILFFVFGYAATVGILMMAQVRKMFPDAITGQAVSALNLFGFLGTFLLQWLMGVVIGGFGVDAGGQYPPIAFATSLGLLAAGNILGLLFYLPLVARRPAKVAVSQ